MDFQEMYFDQFFLGQPLFDECLEHVANCRNLFQEQRTKILGYFKRYYEMGLSEMNAGAVEQMEN
jgi:hypothetical protein